MYAKFDVLFEGLDKKTRNQKIFNETLPVPAGVMGRVVIWGPVVRVVVIIGRIVTVGVGIVTAVRTAVRPT